LRGGPTSFPVVSRQGVARDGWCLATCENGL